MAAPTVLVFENESSVSENLGKFVADKANDAIKRKNIFTVGVSGGSLAKFLCNNLPNHKTDWSKWRMFFCDERYVPYDDAECTYKFYKENLMSKVPLSEENIFPINPNVPVEEAATDYVKKIQSVLPGDGFPRFDLLLLGMGPDGHTCSLFPGHKLLDETSLIVAPITDSPKPPPGRVTMTYPVLNNAACAVFVSCGAGKAEKIQQVLEPGSGVLLPAARVKPTSGEVVWFLDKAAASLLNNKQ
ncbi:6-phosphogluconolactonase-like [Haliotis rufescens]|uniref:6-phosphogluconolactonase-like n=1 Tax=Haliotis rufescens TaxID=6454 RepID=UPI001EAFB34E|nr:6-phosphogluconolactonase-like [Haliotis rufescens]